MKKYYIHCRKEKKAEYTKVLRDYFPNIKVTGDWEKATDVIIVGMLEEDEKSCIEKLEKKTHYMDEDFFPVCCNERMNNLLRQSGDKDEKD